MTEKTGANRTCGECDAMCNKKKYADGSGVKRGNCYFDGSDIDSDWNACDLFDDSGDML
jgi:hypothetical protein